jgi:hypothetical protein
MFRLSIPDAKAIRDLVSIAAQAACIWLSICVTVRSTDGSIPKTSKRIGIGEESPDSVCCANHRSKLAIEIGTMRSGF